MGQGRNVQDVEERGGEKKDDREAETENGGRERRSETGEGGRGPVITSRLEMAGRDEGMRRSDAIRDCAGARDRGP